MTQAVSSLRRRLIIWVMAGLCLLSLILLLELRQSAQLAANKAYDRVLLGAALAIADQVFVLEDQVEVDIPSSALEMLSSEAQDRVYYQVSLSGGDLITGYPDLPLPDIASQAMSSVQNSRNARNARNRGDAHFWDATYRGEKIRLGFIEKDLTSAGGSTSFQVVVAETLDGRTDLMQQMLTGAVLRQISLISLAGIILWAGVGWGLRPLARLTEALSRRNPSDLRPITHIVPDEVQSLVVGINDLMARLAVSLTAMQRFTANAAHQLRTPLAAIQTHAELAVTSQLQAEKEAHLSYLITATRQSSRLIHQLLLMARISPEDVQGQFQTLDLVALCRDLVADYIPQALRKQIDLGLELKGDAPFSIAGNHDLLQEALRNLIENALEYCPNDSVVTLYLSRQGKWVSIEVIDNGPGIQLADPHDVFERFQRGEQTGGNGCGLGLAIVRDIVDVHRGQTALCMTGKTGTCFRINLPIYEKHYKL